MKTLFTALLLFTGVTAFAQDPMYAGLDSKKEAESQLYLEPLPINPSTGKIEFQKIIQAPGKTQAEIHTLAREWFAKTFVSANAVLQMDDKEAGILIGRGKFGTNTDILIKVESKDGRLRYTLTDIVFEFAGNRTAEELITDENLYKPNGKPRPVQKNLKELVLSGNLLLLASLTEAVNTQTTDDNW